MKTSNNIIAASKLALPFHVVSPNEVHSFDNKQEAEEDLAFGQNVIANSSHSTDSIELLTQHDLEQLIRRG